MWKFRFIIFCLCSIAILSFSCSQNTDSKSGKDKKTDDLIDSKKSLVSSKKEKNLKKYTGFLEIDPFRYGKGTQGVTVYTAKGKSIVIEMRYGKEHLQFLNKNVVITGAMASTSTDKSPQGYSYFKTQSIKLASGETPHVIIPTKIPPPPMVYSEKDIKNLKGRWGIAVGKMEIFLDKKIKKHRRKNVVIEKVILTLKDGYKIEKHLYLASSTDSKEYKTGQAGSMIFKYVPNWKEQIIPHKFCPGKQKRCGMDSWKKNKK
jgi:hypothetical protein